MSCPNTTIQLAATRHTVARRRVVHKSRPRPPCAGVGVFGVVYPPDRLCTSSCPGPDRADSRERPNLGSHQARGVSLDAARVSDDPPAQGVPWPRRAAL